MATFASPTPLMTERDLIVGGDQHSALSQLWEDWPAPRLRVLLPGMSPDTGVSIPPAGSTPWEDVETSREPTFEDVVVGPEGDLQARTVTPVVHLPPPGVVAPSMSQETGPSPKGSSKRVRFSLGFRLRRRGRVANALEQCSNYGLGWWSDLTKPGESRAHAWLRSYGLGALPEVVRCSTITGRVDARDPDGRLEEPPGDGGGPGGSDPGSPPGPSGMGPGGVNGSWVVTRTNHPLLSLPFVGDNGQVRSLWVCPELLAELVKVRMFRSATSVLLGSLRGHSRRWAEEHGIDTMDLVRFMPGTVVLAMLPMPDEVTAVAALRGSAARWSTQVLGSLEDGVSRAADQAPLGSYLRAPLSWLFKKEDRRVLAPGVDTLTLHA